MRSKIRQISRYAIYILWSNAIYGLIVYSVFTWLSPYSLLLAYGGNLALIFLGLALDEYSLKMLQSKKLVVQVKEEKDSEKNYRLVQQIMDSFVSFKTALYLFYLFILIFSQIINLYPAFANENIRNFIKANDYSVLFLLALDTLTARFTRDRERMKIISETFKKSMSETEE